LAGAQRARIHQRTTHQKAAPEGQIGQTRWRTGVLGPSLSNASSNLTGTLGYLGRSRFFIVIGTTAARCGLVCSGSRVILVVKSNATRCFPTPKMNWLDRVPSAIPSPPAGSRISTTFCFSGMSPAWADGQPARQVPDLLLNWQIGLSCGHETETRPAKSAIPRRPH
jgi:hypothetical protein